MTSLKKVLKTRRHLNHSISKNILPYSHRESWVFLVNVRKSAITRQNVDCCNWWKKAKLSVFIWPQRSENITWRKSFCRWNIRPNCRFYSRSRPNGLLWPLQPCFFNFFRPDKTTQNTDKLYKNIAFEEYKIPYSN